jgi:hypothetical protein
MSSTHAVLSKEAESRYTRVKRAGPAALAAVAYE